MLRRLILVFVLLASLRGASQSLITIDTLSFTYTYSDTINFQNLDFNASFLIKNVGSTPIYDSVDLVVKVDTGNASLNPFLVLIDTVSLVPGATKSWSVPNTQPTMAFKSGINTVVIWPKAYNPGTLTQDSLFLTVFIDTTGLSAHFPAKPKGFLMFPNPGKEVLNFKSFETNGYYEKVVLFDADGRKALETQFGSQIDISFLRNGVYIVSVETKEGERVKFRFIKE